MARRRRPPEPSHVLSGVDSGPPTTASPGCGCSRREPRRPYSTTERGRGRARNTVGVSPSTAAHPCRRRADTPVRGCRRKRQRWGDSEQSCEATTKERVTTLQQRQQQRQACLCFLLSECNVFASQECCVDVCVRACASALLVVYFCRPCVRFTVQACDRRKSKGGLCDALASRRAHRKRARLRSPRGLTTGWAYTRGQCSSNSTCTGLHYSR